MIIDGVVSIRDLKTLIDEYLLKEKELPTFIEISEMCFKHIQFEAELVCCKLTQEREKLEKMKIKTVSTFQGIEIKIK